MNKQVFLTAATAAAISVCAAWGAAEAQFRLPALAGFTRVNPGAGLDRPSLPPQSHGSRLYLMDAAFETDGAATFLDLDGKVAPAGTLGWRQNLSFTPRDGGRPIRVTLSAPFAMDQLIDRPMEGSLLYRDWYMITDYDRTLTLLLGEDHRFQVIQIGGTDPLSLGRGGHEMDLGLTGLSIRQEKGDTHTFPNPSHGNTHAVPVEVETRDGSVTWLWQGQWVALPGDREGRTLHLLVLVSEVAKPTGNGIHVFEGAPYDLQLLLVTQDR